RSGSAVRAAGERTGGRRAGSAGGAVPSGRGLRAARPIPLESLDPEGRHAPGPRDGGAAPARGRAGVRLARAAGGPGGARARGGGAERVAPPVPLLRRDAPREPQGELLSPVRAAALGGPALPRLRRRGGRGLALLRELRPGDGLRVTHDHRVAVIAGDGIGPEVIEAALGPIERAAAKHGVGLDLERLPYGADHYLATRETLPEPAFRHLRDDVDAILLGAIG